jgi:hypothetical protein
VSIARVEVADARVAAIAADLDRIAIALERIADLLDVPEMPPPDPIPCAHPWSAREDRGSTMGHPRFRCKQCGYEVE